MLRKTFKTIYENQTIIEDEVEKVIQVPKKVLAFFKDNDEITEEEYNALIDALPKPTQPTTSQIEAIQRIDFLKQELARTDYLAIKFAEGELSSAEFEPFKLQRRAWREEINALESGV